MTWISIRLYLLDNVVLYKTNVANHLWPELKPKSIGPRFEMTPINNSSAAEQFEQERSRGTEFYTGGFQRPAAVRRPGRMFQK